MQPIREILNLGLNIASPMKTKPRRYPQLSIWDYVPRPPPPTIVTYILPEGLLLTVPKGPSGQIVGFQGPKTAQSMDFGI